MADPWREFERRTRRSREILQSREDAHTRWRVVGTVDMPHPVYVVEGEGARVVDVDGNEYIDLSMGFGCHVLGTRASRWWWRRCATPRARGVQFGIRHPVPGPARAQLVVDASPCADAVVFCNSGTEATHVRDYAPPRAHSGRTRIALFEGAYHGAHDGVLVKTDDDERPKPAARGRQGSAGVPLRVRRPDPHAALPSRGRLRSHPRACGENSRW